jgi:hypothetical protein
MCLVLVAEAICVAINTSSSSIAAVVFVFAFEACFTWGAYSIHFTLERLSVERNI